MEIKDITKVENVYVDGVKSEKTYKIITTNKIIFVGKNEGTQYSNVLDEWIASGNTITDNGS
jgi:hypothetical protein|tara:strand:- start:152 stop:337 length:186 start_codon:yes stop_codon:yes gene_type:complete